MKGLLALPTSGDSQPRAAAATVSEGPAGLNQAPKRKRVARGSKTGAGDQDEALSAA
jgi:hypothetical protein